MNQTFDASANPFLNGIFAPTQSELHDVPLKVIAGAVPKDLTGTYFRNGPNARFTPIGSYTYPLDGDEHVDPRGQLRRGTGNLQKPLCAHTSDGGGGARRPCAMGRSIYARSNLRPRKSARNSRLATKDLPDVSIVRHAGRLLALAESARPFLLTDNLDTVGPWYFHGKLPKGITRRTPRSTHSLESCRFPIPTPAPFLTGQ